MEHQRLGEHGQFRRTEIVLSVMADDEVLDQCLQLIGEIGQACQLGLQHFQLNDHVPEQLSFSRIRKSAMVSKLVNLADVVQECSRQQQISIDVRIVATHQVAGAAERDHVIEQAADVGVVQSLCGGGVAVGFSDVRIGHERLKQRLEVWILE